MLTLKEPQTNTTDAETLRILVVDDEPHIVNFLRLGLTYEGYVVAAAETGAEALRQVSDFKPHLIILDLMLPDADGFELAQRFSSDPDLLIIMLTARDQVDDRIAGLDAGADDYVVKPFKYEELLARVHAVTRRRRPERADVLKAGPIALDQGRRVVTVNGAVVNLSLKEYELLRLFMFTPGRVLPRRFILERVWGYDFYGDEGNLEVYVGYLRRKLGDEDRQLIQTVRGVGYRLNG